MIKQYLIPKTFTRGNTPLEYEFTVSKSDMRTRESKRIAKYEVKFSIESLFRFSKQCDFIFKIDVFGELRLIAPNGQKAYEFHELLKKNGWKGRD